MPDMTGKKMADLALAKKPKLKVIFTMGYARDVVVNDAVLRASESQLLKPFTVDQLARKIPLCSTRDAAFGSLPMDQPAWVRRSFSIDAVARNRKARVRADLAHVPSFCMRNRGRCAPR